MEGPAETTIYLVAGYGVIFGVMLFYLGSLVVRWRSLRQDEELMEQLDQKK
jgi:hypothetical protein